MEWSRRFEIFCHINSGIIRPCFENGILIDHFTPSLLYNFIMLKSHFQRIQKLHHILEKNIRFPHVEHVPGEDGNNP